METDKNEWIELEEVCKPVSQYLQRKHTPHETIIITVDHYQLVSDVMGSPVKLPDDY